MICLSSKDLDPLYESIASLYGVGPTVAKALERLAGARLIDLLFHLPSGVSFRREIKSLKDAKVGDIVTFRARVLKHQLAGGGQGGARQPYRVYCRLDENMISLVFFHGRSIYLKQQLPENEVAIVSGKLEMYKGQWQITHPDHVGPLETLLEWVGYSPSYPLTQALSQKVLKRILYGVLRKVPELPEWLSAQTLKWHPEWKRWKISLLATHAPKTEADLMPTHPARERLAYDELFANQIALQLVRQFNRRQGGEAKLSQSDLYERALKILPFELTGDQKKVLVDIRADLAATHCMNRLLQGDVGSGKTIVAFLSALIPIESGFQTAMMAPTEILARQHYEVLKPLAEQLGLSIELLTGKGRKADKEKIYKAAAAGDIQILIGTHALIQEELTFQRLGFVVIDEQHRFGVDQRLRLSQKGEHVDCLSMTATPIPRTLMLASYGDLDTSQLREKPAGRKPIQTNAVSNSRLIEVVEGVKRAVSKGDKIFWVCPLVEESEKIDLAAAKDRYEFMEQHLPGQVGLLHGRMKPKEKEAVMKLFTQGILTVLVATTVIEVGVDVKDATVMVIEHAERFGLAQLHQLRGRVGRGEKQGSCILLYDTELPDIGRKRLNIMRQTNDGFEIAEEDWKIRGGGEILGLKQSGLPNFKFVDWTLHQDLLREAVLDAERLVEADPLLDKTPKGQACQNLLRLFDKEETIQYLKAG